MWLDLGVRELVNNTCYYGVCITFRKLRHVSDHFMADVADLAENLQQTIESLQLDAIVKPVGTKLHQTSELSILSMHSLCDRAWESHGRGYATNNV